MDRNGDNYFQQTVSKDELGCQQEMTSQSFIMFRCSPDGHLVGVLQKKVNYEMIP